MISGLIDDYQYPRARYNLEDSLTVILVFNLETKETTIIFSCMQIASTIGGPKSSNRMSGKMYIPFIHELVSVFLDLSGAKNRTKQNNLHTSLFEILLMSGRFFFSVCRRIDVLRS